MSDSIESCVYLGSNKIVTKMLNHRVIGRDWYTRCRSTGIAVTENLSKLSFAFFFTGTALALLRAAICVNTVRARAQMRVTREHSERRKKVARRSVFRRENRCFESKCHKSRHCHCPMKMGTAAVKRSTGVFFRILKYALRRTRECARVTRRYSNFPGRVSRVFA